MTNHITIETRRFFPDGSRDHETHSFASPERALAFLQTRNAYGCHDAWMNGSKLAPFVIPTLAELRAMSTKPDRRPFPSNPRTLAQLVANAPVAVNSSTSCRLIERDA